MGELNVVVQPGVEELRKREGEQDKVIRSKRRETRERQRETERERERENKKPRTLVMCTKARRQTKELRDVVLVKEEGKHTTVRDRMQSVGGKKYMEGNGEW